MIQIYIDEELTSIAEEYTSDPFDNRAPSFSRPINKLTALRDMLEDPNKKRYIQKIIDEYELLNSLRPSMVAAKKEEFDNILPESELNTLISTNKDNTQQKKFYEAIVGAMRYKDLREKDFLPYLNRIGIKACVYCNAQLTIVTKRREGDTIARLELDHHHPKSKYPFLCISFFNLYPVCGCCNKIKSTSELDFKLYTEDSNSERNPFTFSIDHHTIIDYLSDQNDNTLIINFLSNRDNNELSNNHDACFGISGIYNTQKDIAAELIQKAIIYTETYKNNLLETYPFLSSDMTKLNNLIIGNYSTVDNIHKRPMAKFIQDIARQLELID